jgi:hypothetical protein
LDEFQGEPRLTCQHWARARPDAPRTCYHIAAEPQFADFSDWVNVFKPGTGTITVWENQGGKRGDKIYSQSGIPLTPGPLVTVRRRL